MIANNFSRARELYDKLGGKTSKKRATKSKKLKKGGLTTVTEGRTYFMLEVSRENKH